MYHYHMHFFMILLIIFFLNFWVLNLKCFNFFKNETILNWKNIQFLEHFQIDINKAQTLAYITLSICEVKLLNNELIKFLEIRFRLLNLLFTIDMSHDYLKTKNFLEFKKKSVELRESFWECKLMSSYLLDFQPLIYK